MKKYIIVFTLLFALLLTACQSQFEETSQENIVNEIDTEIEKDTYKIALVMKTLSNPFFIEMEKGARKAEDEFGIDLIVKTGANETSIEEQILIVEDMIKDNVDAIVIAPGSSVDLIPVLKKAQDQGIVIINIDNRLDIEKSKQVGLEGVPFISVDNEEGGYLSAKYISDLITEPTDLAILEGIRSADNAEQRKNGALRAFSENQNINIVASESANWKIDEAYDQIAEIYTTNPDIKAIFCANDMMALGVVQYLEENQKYEVLVAGFDALSEATKAIENGKMSVTINQQADIQGYSGIKYAIDMLNQVDVEMEIIIDVKVVSQN